MKKSIGLFLIAAVTIAVLGACFGRGRNDTQRPAIDTAQENSLPPVEDLFQYNDDDFAAAAETIAETATMPPRSFVGTWGDNDAYLTIWDIYDTDIDFYWHISEHISARAMAVIDNNRIVFAVRDDSGHVDDYVYHAVSGTMTFNENGILLTVETSDNPMINSGAAYLYNRDNTSLAETDYAPVTVAKAPDDIAGEYHFFADDQTSERIIFHAKESVENFAYIEILPSVDPEGNFALLIGEALFGLDAFTPENPFVVTVNIGSGIPARGILFWDKGSVRAFYITESGIDGSLMLIEFTPFFG